MSLVPHVMVLPMCLAPLPALLLISVGLIILKRRPGWVARLVAPPFYLVSLPIATLIAGAVMLGFDLLLLLLLLSLGAGEADYQLFLNSYFYYVFDPWVSGRHYLHMLVGCFAGFWVAIIVSGYLLWQTVWRQDDRAAYSRMAGQRLRGLLLLACFAWSFMYLVTYVIHLVTPPGVLDNRG